MITFERMSWLGDRRDKYKYCHLNISNISMNTDR